MTTQLHLSPARFLAPMLVGFLFVVGAVDTLQACTSCLIAARAGSHCTLHDTTGGLSTSINRGTANGENPPPETFRIHPAFGRWTGSVASGSAGGQGDPITLTWGFVDDGTGIVPTPSIPGESSDPSDLINFLDVQTGRDPGSTGGTDLTQRAWFSVFEDSFARLSELSGLTFVYEPNDNGADIDGSSNPQGTLGVYADLRISGHSIDGQAGPNTLAYNYFPNHGDMVIDTDNVSFFSGTSNDSRAFRNVVMHEVGHGLGFSHVESSNAGFLMEPSISTAFDGPQLDDILALHRNYGDANEKAGGNDTSGTATSLGVIGDGQTVSRGTNGNTTFVDPLDVDFISIDGDAGEPSGNLDLDYFSFTLTGPSEVDLTLTPQGATYNEGPQGGTQTSLDTSTLRDLTLRLFDTDGSTSLGTSNSTGAGGSESLLNVNLGPGTYFAQVSGIGTGTGEFADTEVQLYQIDVAVTAVPEPAAYALGVIGLLAFGVVGWRRARKSR